MPSATDIIRLLELKPHPEGGHFRQTFRDTRTVDGARAASTAIYFLLARGERSHWHRVDAVEAWHYHAGAPLSLEIAAGTNGNIDRVTLGPDLMARRTSAGDRAGSRLAGGAKSRRLDAGRLHGGAGLQVRGFRTRAAGLGAAWRGALTTFALITARGHSHEVLAAICRQRRAGDETGIVGGKEQRRNARSPPVRPAGRAEYAAGCFFSSTSLGTALTISVAI